MNNLEGRRHSDSSGPTVDEKHPIDIYSIHEINAGRLVLDLAQARTEFPEEISSRLKTSKDGKYILWPQPTDDPKDPQNWSDRRKNFQLFIVILASILSDFDAAIGIPAVFDLAKQFGKTTTQINDIVQNWSIFVAGCGGLLLVPFVRKYGRLSGLFWTQLLSLGFLVGATLAPNLKTFAAMRVLTAFFGSCPQTIGLYIITDMFPFHLHAQKINLWTMAAVLSPHLSPFLFGFLVARQSWRWAFAVGCFFGLAVMLLITFFLDESLYIRSHWKPSLVERDVRTGISAQASGRIRDLVGITGFQSARPEPTWGEVLSAPFKLVWRPHLLLILIFESAVFGFGIGINVTNTVFLRSPRPFGFGLDSTTVSWIYATPVVSIFVGLFLGRYLNDWIVIREMQRKHGVHEAEARLWTCYIGVLMYAVGFVILGVALQDHLNISALIIGWGIAQAAVLEADV
ncbi:hypothetical protein D9619_002495 [Psilocybe cf. subviscida]|uniref:Major facilitator superfamily (MFS) profile domain-containing protein n=1 Tax=Psilocybe cf. subviscida TaxID=2480587 RepID=A0A8H5AW39_9AGAR|nr:hypothetical protein D9619_002495 [Psilocybe cf. subviscida]